MASPCAVCGVVVVREVALSEPMRHAFGGEIREVFLLGVWWRPGGGGDGLGGCGLAAGGLVLWSLAHYR